jgi:hypothetical protein
MTPGITAAIALPIGGLALAGFAYYMLKDSAAVEPGSIGTGVKVLFGGSIVLAILTAISAVGLGADTQINFRKLSTQQQDERRKATYGLTAMAIGTTILALSIGYKYRAKTPGTGILDLFWKNTTNTGVKLTEPNLRGILVIGTSLVVGVSLALDKMKNQSKRSASEQKKRDAAMGIAFTVFAGSLLFKTYEKAADTKLVDPLINVRKAVQNTATSSTNKLAAISSAIGALKNSEPAKAELMEILGVPRVANNAPNVNAAGRIAAIKSILEGGYSVTRGGALVRSVAGAAAGKARLSTSRPIETVLIVTGWLLTLSGFGLAVDHGVNGQKRTSAERKKRLIAMSVTLSIGVILLGFMYFKYRDFFPPPAAPAGPVDYADVQAALTADNTPQTRQALTVAIDRLALNNPVRRAFNNAIAQAQEGGQGLQQANLAGVRAAFTAAQAEQAAAEQAAAAPERIAAAARTARATAATQARNAARAAAQARPPPPVAPVRNGAPAVAAEAQAVAAEAPAVRNGAPAVRNGAPAVRNGAPAVEAEAPAPPAAVNQAAEAPAQRAASV